MSETPDHYVGKGGIEPFDIIDAFDLGFNLGNVAKYICRAGKKGERLEDLRKARAYLDREIHREKQDVLSRADVVAGNVEDESAPITITRDELTKYTRPHAFEESDVDSVYCRGCSRSQQAPIHYDMKGRAL